MGIVVAPAASVITYGLTLIRPDLRSLQLRAALAAVCALKDLIARPATDPTTRLSLVRPNPARP